MASGSRTSTAGDAERVVGGSVSFSHWSPDGTRILYGDEQKDALMILDLGSSGEDDREVDSAADGSDWLDDGTLMVDGSPES